MNSESRYGRKKQAGYQALLQIKGLTTDMADRLYEAGITSLQDFLEAGTAELEDLTRLPEATVSEMKEEAKILLSIKVTGVVMDSEDSVKTLEPKGGSEEEAPDVSMDESSTAETSSEHVTGE